MHDYGINGYLRQRYIFILTIVAVAVVPFFTILSGWVGVAINVTAFTVFGLLFWLFDNWLWRQKQLSWLVKIPDLSGDWICEGTTHEIEGNPQSWSGRVRILQSWSKISINLETDESRSSSIVAVIQDVPGHGYRLIFCYANERKIPDKQILPHSGTAVLMVSEDLQSASANYYNDYSRRTTGTMNWSRVSQNNGD